MDAQQMKGWRAAWALTQDQLAEMLEVTSRAVKKWEAGEAPIDARTVQAMSRLELLRGCETERARLTEAIADLESGRFQMRHRAPGRGWEDHTRSTIERYARNIADLDRLIEEHAPARWKEMLERLQERDTRRPTGE